MSLSLKTRNLLRDGDLVKVVGSTSFLRLTGKWPKAVVEELRKKAASEEESTKMDDKLAQEDVKENAVAVEKTAAEKTTMERKKEKKLTTVGGKIVIQEGEVSGTTNGKDKEKIAAGDQLVATSSGKEILQAQPTVVAGDIEEKEEVDGSSAEFVRSARARWLSLL